MTQFQAMLEFLGALLVTWPIHLVPAIAIALPTAILTRKAFGWHASDLTGFFVPWLVWCVVFAFGPRPASLTSAVAESLLVGLAVGVGFFSLPHLAKKARATLLRPILLASACVLALVLWAVFPLLGE